MVTSHRTLPFGNEVTAKLESIVSNLGLELCHVDWRPQKRRGVLTLYIDREGGVSLEDCVSTSHAVEGFLEELPDLGAFVLEVSSPGLDRPLWSLGDCVRFCGQRVRVQLNVPTEGTARIKGVLEKVEGESLTILDEDRHRHYTVRFSDVKLARLIPEF